MNKKPTLTIILIVLFLSILFINFFLNNKTQKTIISNMIKDVSYLSSDDLEGRKIGTKGEKLAAEYIVEKFKQYDLIEKGIDGYYQYFNASIRENPHSRVIKNKVQGINVIGFIDNKMKETIILGAHYDHLGFGGPGSLFLDSMQIHNGADDNASGVSVLLSLIPELSRHKIYNYLFIAFSGEEQGLFGSSFYAKNPTIDLENVRFMLNFDMVGRLSQDNILAINGTGTSSKWKKLLQDVNIDNFNLRTSESGTGPSDHTSFYLQNIPVLHFFTGQHQDYHKPTDDVDKINFKGMYKITKYVKNIILKSSKITDFDFKETVSSATTTPKFKVTLGIMPDYLFDGVGLRIDGVSKDRTAFKAGILKGDIVLSMGGDEVNDIMQYMKALSKYKIGDSTSVKLLRKSDTIQVPVFFFK